MFQSWLTVACTADTPSRESSKEFWDTSNFVVLEFKFRDAADPGITTSANFYRNRRRMYGWIYGGRTKGNAREWVVPQDAIAAGLIDRSSIVIKGLK